MKRFLSLFLSVVMLFGIIAGLDLCVYARTSGDFEYSVTTNKAKITKYKGTSGIVSIPEKIGNYTVTEIGKNAFKSNTKLTSLTIPDTVVYIGEDAFFNCKNLSDLTLPCSAEIYSVWDYLNDSLVYKSSFDRCSNIKSVRVTKGTDGVLWCEVDQFYTNACTPWYISRNVCQNIVLEEGVTYIGAMAFSDCEKLTKIELPESIEYVGIGAFSNCSSLKNIYIGKNVQEIENDAFEGCTALSHIDVSENNKMFSAVEGVLFNKDESELIYYPSEKKDLTFYIFDTVSEISNSAFDDAKYLTAINVDDKNECFLSQDGILYNKDKTELIKYPNKKYGISYSIPDSVEGIKGGFKNCFYLENVTTGKSMKIVDGFRECNSLKNITISDEAECIADYAFYGCTNLESVTFGSNIKVIAPDAFSNCDQVVLFFNGTEKAWNEIDFETIDGWNSVRNKTIICADGIINCKHKFDKSEIIEKATCKKMGVKVYTCSICGDTYEEIIPKTAHKYDNGKVTKKATCKATGVKTYTCQTCGAAKTETIAKAGHTYKNVVTKATLSKNGKIDNKCSVCGKVSKTTTVYYPKTIKLSKSTFVYNGKAQKPSVTVKDSKGNTLKLNKDYTVSYSNASSKNVGKYTVTIKFKGNYTGTKTIGYHINPKGTEFVPSNKGGFKAIKNGFTLKWNKQSSQTTGYQIQYATKSDFSNAATITIANPNTTSYTIKGKAANTRYYVRVRTYKKIGTGTFYSIWNSGTKSVVTLK